MKALKEIQAISPADRARKPLKRFAGWLLMLLFLLMAAPDTKAQIGTYVVPRPITLFSGVVSNNQSFTNVVIWTNLLNYSGFHRMSLFATTTFTNPAGVLNSNVTASIDLTPGNANGYTNSVMGTNFPFTTTQPISWTFQVKTNQMTFTNLDWNFVDSVAAFKLTTLQSFTTNGGPPASYLLQLDAVLTP